MASARLTARRVRRSSPSLTSPKVACAHVFGDITALHSSISLSFRFTLLSQFYHFFTRTMWEQVRTSTRPPPCPTSAPCPYRTGRRAFPGLVVKNHQDGAAPLPYQAITSDEDAHVLN